MGRGGRKSPEPGARLHSISQVAQRKKVRQMNGNQFGKLIAFLERLDSAKIAYTLGHDSYDSIQVTIVIPGEHWEVDFLESGDVYVERFRSKGEIQEESA